jgi:hypothetical protein
MVYLVENILFCMEINTFINEEKIIFSSKDSGTGNTSTVVVLQMHECNKIIILLLQN